MASFVEAARQQGYSLSEIQSRVSRWVSLQPPDHILAIEPDAELRAILMFELGRVIPMRIEGAGMDASSNGTKLLGAFCVAFPDHAEELRSSLPPEIPSLVLTPRSVSRSVSGQPRPPLDTPDDVARSGRGIGCPGTRRDTHDVRRRHRRPADAVDGDVARVPRRQDIDPGADDVDARSPVREAREAIVEIRRRHGHRGLDPRRRVVAGVRAALL